MDELRLRRWYMVEGVGPRYVMHPEAPDRMRVRSMRGGTDCVHPDQLTQPMSLEERRQYQARMDAFHGPLGTCDEWGKPDTVAMTLEREVEIRALLRKRPEDWPHPEPHACVAELLDEVERLRKIVGEIPKGESWVGLAGIRDPDFPCLDYDPGTPSEENTCYGDGHGLCEECSHFKPKGEEG